MSWHDFIFGAADPWGTVSVDKLPGALWMQALSLRIFGFHVWALVLPQVVEGMLTVLVLYRAVRRVAGAGAGITAAVVMASSPIVILLDRGNISDSLLILLLVLAADATIRADADRAPAFARVGGRAGRLRVPGEDAPSLARPARFLLGLPRRRARGIVHPAGRPPCAGHPRHRCRLSQLDVGRLPRPGLQPPLRRRELQRLSLQPGVQLQRVQPPRRLLRQHGGMQRSLYLLDHRVQVRRQAQRRHLRHRRVVGPPAARPLRPRRRLVVAPCARRDGVAPRAPAAAPAHRPPARLRDPVVRLARADLRVLQRQPVLELLLHGRARFHRWRRCAAWASLRRGIGGAPVSCGGRSPS